MEEILRKVSEAAGREVTAETRVEDLDLDSLELLELMHELGIPLEAIDEIETVADLARRSRAGNAE
jgi:acyl carrier protein